MMVMVVVRGVRAMVVVVVRGVGAMVVVVLTFIEQCSIHLVLSCSVIIRLIFVSADA